MDVLQRMRQAISEQRYRISSHASDEIADDFLVVADVENIILTGKITRKFTHDQRGTRYIKCLATPLTTVVRMSCVAFCCQAYC